MNREVRKRREGAGAYRGKKKSGRITPGDVIYTSTWCEFNLSSEFRPSYFYNVSIHSSTLGLLRLCEEKTKKKLLKGGLKKYHIIKIFFYRKYTLTLYKSNS